MSIDACTLKNLSRELAGKLLPARVDKLQQVGKNSLLLNLRTRQGRYKLLLSADANESTVYLTDEQWQSPDRPPAFLQQARKQLQGAELNCLFQVPDERILILGFTRFNELGDEEDLRLIAELMGRHANLILCRDETIIDAIKHIDSSQSRYREVLPLRPYVKPPEQDSLSPRELLQGIRAGQDLRTLIPVKGRTGPLDKFLVRSIAAISPLIISDSLELFGLDTRLDYARMSEDQLVLLSQALSQVCEAYLAESEAGYIYYQDADLQSAFACHSMDFKSLVYRKSFPSISQALTVFYSQKHQEAEFESYQQSVLRDQAKLLKTANRKYELHQRDLDACADRLKFKARTELLQANFPALKKLEPGASQVKLINYWDPDLVEVTVPLNPKIPPMQNADYYSKLYKKQTLKAEKVEKLIQLDLQLIEYLDQLSQNIRRAKSLPDLDACTEDLDYLKSLRQLGAESRQQDKQSGQAAANMNRHPDLVGRKRSKAKPKQQGKSKKVKQAKTRALRPRRFEYQGLRIEVGRNNLQNEDLSLRRAAKGSQWFHLKNQPGAHVVVHAEASELSRDQAQVAAQLAAWYSSANQGFGQVIAEVDQCTVGRLRKVKGLAPGQVLYHSESSYMVKTMGPDQIEGLVSEDQ